MLTCEGKTFDTNGEQMKQYVACILFDKYFSQVMLIRKNRPEWMKGKLNGIGGHIENDETPLTAICREFTEETGLQNPIWKPFAILSGEDDERKPFRVFWFTTIIDNPDDWRATNYDEPVNWHRLIDDSHSIIPNNMMPNLQWLIEMAKTHLKGNDRATWHNIQEMYQT